MGWWWLEESYVKEKKAHDFVKNNKCKINVLIIKKWRSKKSDNQNLYYWKGGKEDNKHITWLKLHKQKKDCWWSYSLLLCNNFLKKHRTQKEEEEAGEKKYEHAICIDNLTEEVFKAKIKVKMKKTDYKATAFFFLLFNVFIL